jgi:hypothetical protein
MRRHFFLAEGFSLVFTNTYVKTACIDDTYVNSTYVNSTYVNNTYVDRIFVLNLGCDVRSRLQPGPS